VTSPVQLPDRISGFRSGAINGILDYLESLRPIDTRSVWHEWTPGGVASHGASGASGTVMEAEPWDVTSFSPSTGSVTLETGDVEIHGETLAGTTTSYVTPASLTLTISTSGTVYVWLEAAWSGSAWSASLGSGTSKPNDTGSAYRKLLWSFLNGVPAKRWHRGNVEFVGWRPE
jgi:hypothetical protein